MAQARELALRDVFAGQAEGATLHGETIGSALRQGLVAVMRMMRSPEPLSVVR